VSEKALLDKSKAKNKDKLASRFRKRPANITRIIKLYNSLCDSCKIYVRIQVEKGEKVGLEDFCDDCKAEAMPLLGKIKEKLEK
jgi:hypothetical protein